jgi:hypothetical protein
MAQGRLLKGVLLWLVAVFASFVSVPAFSTPMIDVQAFWSVSARVPGTTIPDGISFSCFGGASGNADGCGDSRSLNTSVLTSEHLSASATSGLEIINTSDHFFTGSLVFATDFSSCNNSGCLAITIDDPAFQFGGYSSSVSGPGVGDSHNCSVGFLGNSGFQVFSPTHCGVPGPDSSQNVIFVDVSTLAPGGTIDLSYSINITADFVLVPEPETIWLFGCALAALGTLVLLTGLRNPRASDAVFSQL